MQQRAFAKLTTNGGEHTVIPDPSNLSLRKLLGAPWKAAIGLTRRGGYATHIGHSTVGQGPFQECAPQLQIRARWRVVIAPLRARIIVTKPGDTEGGCAGRAMLG